MNTKRLVFILSLVIILLLQAFSPSQASAAGPVGTGIVGSCNEAALEAALAGGGLVTFNCGGPATITLTSTKVISQNTQINGAGIITLSGGDSVRLFTVNSPAVFELANLTLSHGSANAADGGALLINSGATVNITNSTLSNNETTDGYGGAVMIDGVATVNIANSTLSNNTATNSTVSVGEVIDGHGGAVMIRGAATVNITNSTLSNNSVMNGYGGAVYVGGGNLNVVDSTFINNNADVEGLGNLSLGGGAIQNNDGTVNVSGSTFKGNSVTSHTADGGAIYNGDYDGGTDPRDPENGNPDNKPDTLHVINSTFYGNHLLNTSGLPTSGSSAGAIRSASVLTIESSTFSDNDSGVPVQNGAAGAITITHGTAVYTNNIFANSTGDDCAVRANLDSQTSINNLFEKDTQPLKGWSCWKVTDVVFHGDPLLGPLQDNGGPTETMALGDGSLAIDHAASCTVNKDQRGVQRPQPSGSNCDLGAYELDNVRPTITNVSSTNENGIYGMENVIYITITFNEIVLVEGIPQLTLETGTTDQQANYTDGSGTNTLTFSYTVQDGDMAADLDYVPAGALHLNGGSIKDTASNPADLTLPNPGEAGSLGANKDIKIDTHAPILKSFMRHNPATQFTNADTLVFRASFSGKVLNVDTGDFETSGATTATVTGVTAINTNTFDITVSGGNLADFIGTVGINLRSGQQDITDKNGVALPDGEPTIDETYTLDNVTPNVVSILRTDPDPTTADVVHYAVTFSKPVVNVGLNDFVLSKKGTNGASVTNVTGTGQFYTVTVNTGKRYGMLRLDVPASATIQDLAGNPVNGLPFTAGQVYTINKPPTFIDVPPTHPYWEYIEILYANNYTSGCTTSPLRFCPDKTMNRGEAAVFIIRGTKGAGYNPGTATHMFKDDWRPGPWAEPWAEAMKTNNISAGCQTLPVLKYCPWDNIPREQAVVFAVRLKHGIDYRPPAATGTMFADMTDPNSLYTAWAEQAYKDELIPSCGMYNGKPKICPKALVTRGLAAYMIVRAKDLLMP